MEHLLHLLSPVDILVGGLAFIVGSVSGIKKYQQTPYRNLSILLQVSLLIVKMAKYYFDTHPSAKEKVNHQIVVRLDRISTQLHQYMHGTNEKAVANEPLG